MLEIPDVLLERLLHRLPPEGLIEGAEEALAKRDYRLALVLILSLLAQRRGLRVSLPTLLRAAVGAEALLSPEKET